MGRLDMRNSALAKYPWTNDQEGMFNNEMLRNYAQKPQYFFYCDENLKPHWIGNATGIFGYPTPLLEHPLD